MPSKKYQHLLEKAGLANQDGGKITPDALRARIARGGEDNVVHVKGEKIVKPSLEVTLRVCCTRERVVVI